MALVSSTTLSSLRGGLLLSLLLVVLLTPTPSHAQNCGISRRRPWRSLSCNEQDRFLAAITALKASGRYDDIARIHWQTGGAAHQVPAFLPWHRHYIAIFEQELQRVTGDCSITIPFWDWERDGGGWNIVLRANTFGRQQGGCIRDGIAAGWTSQNGGCLTREFDRRISLSRDVEVLSRITNSRTFSQFRVQLEGAPHASVHQYVGGSMGDNFSPEDPLFWIHHCNVDRIWTLWQNYNGHADLRANPQGWGGGQHYDGNLDTPLVFRGDRTGLFNNPPTPRDVLANNDVQYVDDNLARNLIQTSTQFANDIHTGWNMQGRAGEGCGNGNNNLGGNGNGNGNGNNNGNNNGEDDEEDNNQVCRGDNQGCIRDDQCCSGDCNNRRCQPEEEEEEDNNNRCRATNSFCNNDDECCSGDCTNRRCRPEQEEEEEEVCRGDNQWCIRDDQCCSGDCSNRRCQESEEEEEEDNRCRATNSWCTDDDQCCSGDCNNRRCRPEEDEDDEEEEDNRCRATNSFCEDDDQCCSGDCSNRRCRPEEDDEDNRCRMTNSWCDDDDQCCSGDCSNRRCRPEEDENDEEEDNTLRTCRTDNQWCNRDDDCCSGDCSNRRCEGNGNPQVGRVRRRSQDDGDEEQNGCRDESEQCRVDRQCCSGTCQNWVCVDPPRQQQQQQPPPPQAGSCTGVWNFCSSMDECCGGTECSRGRCRPTNGRMWDRRNLRNNNNNNSNTTTTTTTGRILQSNKGGSGAEYWHDDDTEPYLSSTELDIRWHELMDLYDGNNCGGIFDILGEEDCTKRSEAAGHNLISATTPWIQSKPHLTKEEIHSFDCHYVAT